MRQRRAQFVRNVGNEIGFQALQFRKPEQGILQLFGAFRNFLLQAGVSLIKSTLQLQNDFGDHAVEGVAVEVTQHHQSLPQAYGAAFFSALALIIERLIQLARGNQASTYQALAQPRH